MCKGHRTVQQQAVGMLRRALRRFNLTSKLKVAWGFYQITSKIQAVYHLNSLPSNVDGLLGAFGFVISLGFDKMGSVLSCAGLSSEVNTLTFYVIAPILIGLVTSTAVLLWTGAAARWRGEPSWRRLALLASLRPTLLVAFGFYPIVSSVAFQAFACEPLGDASLRYLPPTYTLECGPEGDPTDERLACHFLA